jgi:hypothetical protein
MGRSDGNVTIEDARLVFRNFKGKEGKYNREGDRSFAILLDDDLAELMARDGWNVKYLHAREAGEGDQAYISVAVNYGKGRPPRVVLITSGGRNPLGEDEVEILDWVDAELWDVVLRPYRWTVQDDSGVKAYLKTMFVTLAEDDLERKYAENDEAETARGSKWDDIRNHDGEDRP